MDILQELENNFIRLKNKYKSSRKIAFKFGLYSLKKAILPVRISNRSNHKTDNKTIEIAFLLRGGLGDIILAGRYIYEFKKKFHSDIVIDVFSNFTSHILNSLFYKHNLARKSALLNDFDEKQYDLTIDVVRFPFIKSSNKPKIQSISPKLNEFCDNLLDFQKKNAIFFRDIPHHDYLSVQFAKIKNYKREYQIDILNQFNLHNSDFRLYYDINAEQILKKYTLNSDGFLTIQRGVGNADSINNQSTRLWSVEYYQELISIIKAQFPQYIIIQLGSPLTDQINGIDIDLRGKTSFEELKVLLVHSKLHIDGDCGMVHIRHFLNAKPSCVLFGPTDESWLGYSENLNLANRPCHTACEWIVPYWRNQCILDLRSPLCQERLTPSNVFKKIQGILI